MSLRDRLQFPSANLEQARGVLEQYLTTQTFESLSALGVTLHEAPGFSEESVSLLKSRTNLVRFTFDRDRPKIWMFAILQNGERCTELLSTLYRHAKAGCSAALDRPDEVILSSMAIDLICGVLGAWRLYSQGHSRRGLVPSHLRLMPHLLSNHRELIQLMEDLSSGLDGEVALVFGLGSASRLHSLTSYLREVCLTHLERDWSVAPKIPLRSEEDVSTRADRIRRVLIPPDQVDAFLQDVMRNLLIAPLSVLGPLRLLSPVAAPREGVMAESTRLVDSFLTRFAEFSAEMHPSIEDLLDDRGISALFGTLDCCSEDPNYGMPLVEFLSPDAPLGTFSGAHIRLVKRVLQRMHQSHSTDGTRFHRAEFWILAGLTSYLVHECGLTWLSSTVPRFFEDAKDLEVVKACLAAEEERSKLLRLRLWLDIMETEHEITSAHRAEILQHAGSYLQLENPRFIGTDEMDQFPDL